jgi:hypothetical protein
VIEGYDPNNEADRIGLALLAIIQNQLELLGFEIGAVPLNDRFASDKCRGALLGTAFGVTQAEVENPSNKTLIDAAMAAFSLVYGNEVGNGLALQTMRDAAGENAELQAASDWAINDTKGVYSSGGVTSAVGYYAAVSGMI